MAKRNLYLTNTPVDEAKETYEKSLSAFLQKQTEKIAVIDALDRVTADPVFAGLNSPLSDSAAMDGIAVIAEETRGASETTPISLALDKQFIPVDTGDPIRPPYNAVIMAEDVLELGDGGVEIRSAASPWQHVRPIGEDIVQGEMILPGAHRIRPFDLGVLLSGGITQIEVIRKPRVGIIPTGTEIIEPGEIPKEGDIIESNSRMFAGLVVQDGGVPDRKPPTPDVYEQLRNVILQTVDQCDLVLINAGSSAGRDDYTVHLLRELGEVVIHGVAMKPGKPVILAIVKGKPVIGLPGYPVSAYLAYQVFVRPLVTKLSGLGQGTEEQIQAVITRRMISSLKHREYVRVKVGQVGETLVATPLARGAGAAMSLVRADGFCIIPQNTEGIEAGSEVTVQLIRPLSALSSMVVSIGSHDLILDVIQDLMVRRGTSASLSSTHVGSMGGLMALRKGEAHVAPIHLLSHEDGQYNLSFLKSMFPPEEMALIKGVGRTQGIMVKKGNPLGIRSIEDLTRCRFVNRQRGAGTRLLFDYELSKREIDPKDIPGYDREAATHMAVAAAVKSESADAGMGIYSSAEALSLDFIPVGEEEYDFALPKKFLELPQIKVFIDVLSSPEFKRKLCALGGYTAERCGEVVFLDGRS